MSEPTVQEILNLSDQPKENQRKFPLWLVVGAFFLFTPLAFVFMWIDDTYHTRLRLWLFIFGGLFIFYSLSLLFTISKLGTLYSELNIAPSNVSITSFFVFLLFILGLAMVVFCYFYKPEKKTHVAAAALMLTISTSLIGILIALEVISIILPLYSATSNF